MLISGCILHYYTRNKFVKGYKEYNLKGGCIRMSQADIDSIEITGIFLNSLNACRDEYLKE